MIAGTARIVARHPWAVLAGVALLTAAAVASLVDLRALAAGEGAGAVRLVIDPAQDGIVPEDDPGRLYYERIRTLFGNDETLLLVAIAEEGPAGIWTPGFLAALDAATEAIEALPDVRSVFSLANAPNVSSDGADLRIAPIWDEPPRTPDAIAAARRALAQNPILSGGVVTRDARAAVIVVYLRDVGEVEFTASRLDHRIRDLAEEAFAGHGRVLLTGGLHVKAETSRLLARDMAFVGPLSGILLTAIAFLGLRTLRGLLIPLASIAVALVWTLGLQARVRPELDFVTAMVPALVLVVGFAYAVYMLSAYYDHLVERRRRGPGEGRASAAPGAPAALGAPTAPGGPGPPSATEMALRHVLLPTFLTGLTTAAGFLSLLTSNLSAIRSFGVFCAIGVGCAMLSAVTFAPAVLVLLPERLPRARRRAAGGNDRIDRLLLALGGVVVRHRRAVLLAGAGVAGVAALGMLRIEVSTDMVESFPPGSPVRAAIEEVNAVVGASDQVYVIVEAPYKGALKEPESLRRVAALQEWLEAQPEVGGVTSLVDYVKLLNRGLHEGDPAHFAVPATARMVGQILFFGAGPETRRIVDSQYRVTSLPVRINVSNSGEMVEFVERVEARLAELAEGPVPLAGRITGNSVLLAGTADDIARGQALSLGTAFVIIFVILALLFTSLRVGLLAMIPNVLPVLVYFGALGWTGTSLNTTTGLVACLVLGIAVDDTIHFLATFNAEAKGRADEAEGVKQALRRVGRPVTYTSAALCTGFATLGLSELQQQADFGLLGAFALFAAWATDVTFTPALARGMRIVTLWDVVSLDLGERPQEAIPLLRGLSTRQARITALMTEIVERPAGHRLVSAGAKDVEEMFVIVHGRLSSHVERDGVRVPLNVHERGDVIGEVGLFTGERTAHVDCDTDVTLLRLDERNLARLRRRYPRIAAQVFRNLSEILAGRLVSATSRVA